MLDGPCVTVDHMLEKTKAANVAALDGLINERKLWDTTAPLHIVEAEKPRTATVYANSRVGLSLKKAKGKADAPKFVARPYRYLTEPKEIAKAQAAPDSGRCTALDARRRRFARSPAMLQATIDRYIADFTLGTTVASFDAYIGAELGTAELCKLLGTWSARASIRAKATCDWHRRTRSPQGPANGLGG